MSDSRPVGLGAALLLANVGVQVKSVSDDEMVHLEVVVVEELVADTLGVDVFGVDSVDSVVSVAERL